MAKVGSITVGVKTKLTISDDTANTILGLLEMYCQEKGRAITTETRITEERTREPILCFIPFITKEQDGNEETESEEE